MAISQSGKRRQQVGSCGVVAKGLAQVGEAVFVAGPEDKTAAQLEGIFAQLVLAMPAGLGALAGNGIVFAEQMEQGGVLETDGPVSLALLVHQEWKIDFGVFPELLGVVRVTQADSDQRGAFLAEGLLVLAQLRDMLAAEDSTPMAKENDNRRAVCPQRSQADRLAVNVG
jgi:hypothetical protein